MWTNMFSCTCAFGCGLTGRAFLRSWLAYGLVAQADVSGGKLARLSSIVWE